MFCSRVTFNDSVTVCVSNNDRRVRLRQSFGKIREYMHRQQCFPSSLQSHGYYVNNFLFTC